jgi:hypothetical protein
MDMICLKPLESIKYIHIEYQTAQRAATHTIFSHFIPEMSPLKYAQEPTSRSVEARSSGYGEKGAVRQL